MKVGVLTGVEVGDGVGLAGMVGVAEVATAVNVIATAVSIVWMELVMLNVGLQALSKMAANKMKPGKTFLEIYIRPCDFF